ncbi:kinesin-like protein [Plakobranchus ocellatus]|uniref:Kinesin-like protein n=1 Tax=Plakobranchus ocellatus TaxID=259542 RepID=A0AAV4ABW6_9GAST|nr:kinesin-like protein [Plakobranchus ocellatus]
MAQLLFNPTGRRKFLPIDLDSDSDDGGISSYFGSSTTLSSNTDNSEDADDNFNVVLRVRPPNAQERNRKDQFVVDFPGDGQVSVNNQGTVRSFQFNVVLEPDAAQEDVFESSGMKKLIDAAILGYTCTAFAFGQTGSGKTHTMTGPPAQFHTEGVTPDPNMYGIIQRSFKHLFQQLKRQSAPKYVRASYMEIYNEQVIDLLNPNQRRYLSVRWSKNKGFYVENLFTVECETIDDLMAVLEEGLRNRQTGSHGLNEFSSRSHSVLTVTIDSETQPEPEDENLYVTKRGKISFVDLAGSEKVKDSTAPGGPGMLESNSINKSLLVLGNCISHLGDSKRRLGHIPYRDSKLTKLLADSLGGNGITLMIACITPSSSNVTETLNTLRYASRAKKIKSKPTVKMDPREKLIVTLKKEIKILRQENHYLRQQESSRREQQILYKENEKLSRRVEELERLMSEHPGTWSLVDHRRTDGYGQHDLSPRGSPVTVGYMSPTGTHRSTIRPTDLPVSGGRVKVSSPTSHGQPKKPPHRLADHVTRPVPRPIDLVEDIPNGYISPRQASLVKQGAMSPRPLDRKASQVSQTDLIRGMNEQLRREVMQLDGEIQHHTRGATQAMAKSYFR